jgi:hypothetical protein
VISPRGLFFCPVAARPPPHQNRTHLTKPDRLPGAIDLQRVLSGVFGEGFVTAPIGPIGNNPSSACLAGPAARSPKKVCRRGETTELHVGDRRGRRSECEVGPSRCHDAGSRQASGSLSPLSVIWPDQTSTTLREADAFGAHLRQAEIDGRPPVVAFGSGPRPADLGLWAFNDFVPENPVQKPVRTFSLRSTLRMGFSEPAVSL